MHCQQCDLDEPLPFRCRYCKGSFCSAHRLPPSHHCPFLREYIEQPARNREFLERIQGRSGPSALRIKTAIKDVILLRFSLIELVHLAIATALVSAVGLSLFNYVFRVDFLVIFVSAFIIHELGHKFLAQFYKAWAEFRVLLYGAAITAFAALPFSPIKFIAPGAVMVSGNLSNSRSGKVSWIGPLTNIVMGTGFLLAFYLTTLAGSYQYAQILLIGVRFNGIIALFNLIPFMGFDGQSIFSWNKIAWVATIAAAGLLYLFGDLASGGAIAGLLHHMR